MGLSQRLIKENYSRSAKLGGRTVTDQAAQKGRTTDYHDCPEAPRREVASQQPRRPWRWDASWESPGGPKSASAADGWQLAAQQHIRPTAALDCTAATAPEPQAASIYHHGDSEAGWLGGWRPGFSGCFMVV